MEEIIKIRKQKFEEQQRNSCSVLINKVLNSDIETIEFKQNLLEISMIIFDDIKDNFLIELNKYLLNIKTKKKYLDVLIEIFKINKEFFDSFEDTIVNNIISFKELECFDLKDYYKISDKIDLTIDNYYIKQRRILNLITDGFKDNKEITMGDIELIRFKKLLNVLFNQSILVEEFKEKVFNNLSFTKYINLENKEKIEEILTLLQAIYSSFNIDIDYNIESIEELDRKFAEELNLK